MATTFTLDSSGQTSAFSYSFGRVLFYDGYMWTIGGNYYNAIGADTRVSRSSDNGLTWNVITNSLPSTLVHSTIVYNGYMWAIGGENARVLRSSDGINWTTMYFPGTSPYSPASCIHNGRLYFSGGIGYSNNNASTGVFSTTDGINWTTHRAHGDSGSFTGRANHQMYSLNGRLWIGGGNTDIGVATPDLWYSDDNGTTWNLQGSFSYNLTSDSTIEAYGVLYVLNAVGSLFYYSYNGYDWISETTNGSGTGTQRGFGYNTDKLYMVGGAAGASFPIGTSYSAPLPFPYYSSIIDFNINYVHSPSPAYLRNIDTSQIYDLSGGTVTGYLRIWQIYNNRTSASTFISATSETVDFVLEGLYGDTFNVSLSAVY